MIKVNLLRNKVGGTKTAVSQASESEENFVFENQSAEAGENKKGLIVKIFIIFGGIVCLYGYQNYNISLLQDQANALVAEKQTLDAQILAKKPVAEKAAKLQKENQELEKRIASVKNLSKFRLRELRTLDYIQNVIPDRLWLTGVKVNGGSIELQGGSLADDDLSKFLDLLETKPWFKDVILLQAIEAKTKTGTSKTFLIRMSQTESGT
jgi:Tfp pilus assembly protein PilN